MTLTFLAASDSLKRVRIKLHRRRHIIQVPFRSSVRPVFSCRYTFGYQCEHPALSPCPQELDLQTCRCLQPKPAAGCCSISSRANSSSRRGPWEWKHFGSVVLKIKSEALAHPTYESKKELAGEKGPGMIRSLSRRKHIDTQPQSPTQSKKKQPSRPSTAWDLAFDVRVFRAGHHRCSLLSLMGLLGFQLSPAH